MKFIGTALMAIVALTSSTEAVNNYSDISRDCRNVSWTITVYSGPKCTGAKQVMNVGKPPKCDVNGQYSFNYKCNTKEFGIVMHKGTDCTGERLRKPPAGYDGPVNLPKMEWDYDGCQRWNDDDTKGKTFRIHPNAKRQ